MPRYQYTGDSRVVFPHLTVAEPDGRLHGCEVGPGDVVDIPDGADDPLLVLVPDSTPAAPAVTDTPTEV